MLGVVTSALLLNQLFVAIYVVAVHDGDPGFIAGHLPDGWFDLWTPAWLVELAHRWPAPQLLSPSVLVVPAFLELPFVMLAYLVVVRWLDPASYRRLATGWMVWVASAVWTAVFCAVEIDLANPRTPADLTMRVLAAVVTPWVVARSARREQPTAAGGTTVGSLITFGASAALLGSLVLVVYDTVLLYNPGRLPTMLPWAGATLGLLVAVRWWAARGRHEGATGLGVIALVGGSTRHLVMLFFVPALAVRYLMSYYGGALAGAALVVLALASAAFLSVRDLRGRSDPRDFVRVVAATAVAVAPSAGLALVAAASVRTSYVEQALGVGAVVGFVAVVALGALADAAIGGGVSRPASPGRTPAPGRRPPAGGAR